MAESLINRFFRSGRGERPKAGARQARHGVRQRLVQYFDCTWVGACGPVEARISNLSPTGCYIDSRFTVPAVGTTLDSITVDAGSGRPLVLTGAVAEATPGVGFAVRFAQLDEDTRARLLAVVRPSQSRPSP